MVLFEIGFIKITLIDLIDLGLVSWLFYRVYTYFRGTRAGQMLIGLIILMIGSFIYNNPFLAKVLFSGNGKSTTMRPSIFDF